MSVIESLFVTRLQEDGSHWAMTLSVYASRFLADIEHLFEPRDHSFTMVGIEINATPAHVHVSGIQTVESRLTILRGGLGMSLFG